MIAFRFGPPGQQLYGVFHPSTGLPRRNISVLLCNPFGQEAVRTNRLYRMLAERLATKGYDILRFDYFATGESAGQDDQGDLDRWREDIVEAHRELARRSRTRRQVWLGARLRATLALLSSGQAEHAPELLILWDPVVDGGSYLRELDLGHARQIRSSFSIVPAGLTTARQREALGFATSESFEAQLASLCLERLASTRTRQVRLLAPVTDEPSHALVQQLGSTGVDCRLDEFDHAFDWVSEEALNTALVPAEALQRLLALVEEPAA